MRVKPSGQETSRRPSEAGQDSAGPDAGGCRLAVGIHVLSNQAVGVGQQRTQRPPIARDRRPIAGRCPVARGHSRCAGARLSPGPAQSTNGLSPQRGEASGAEGTQNEAAEADSSDRPRRGSTSRPSTSSRKHSISSGHRPSSQAQSVIIKPTSARRVSWSRPWENTAKSPRIPSRMGHPRTANGAGRFYHVECSSPALSCP